MTKEDKVTILINLPDRYEAKATILINLPDR